MANNLKASSTQIYQLALLSLQSLDQRNTLNATQHRDNAKNICWVNEAINIKTLFLIEVLPPSVELVE